MRSGMTSISLIVCRGTETEAAACACFGVSLWRIKVHCTYSQVESTNSSSSIQNCTYRRCEFERKFT